MTQGNSGQPPADRTPSRAPIVRDGQPAPSGLDRVRAAARRAPIAGNGLPTLRFTGLLHHITPSLLGDAYHALRRQAAPGVDGETWASYGEGDLEARLADLHARIHRGSYRAMPSKRAWIPKGDGRMRPLGIAALEDKIVQQAVAWVLGAIYEADFLGVSYGFRPGRRQHDALDALGVALTEHKVNWVLDCDIRSFFDRIVHERRIELMERRIGDRRVLRLLRQWLRAGVLEDGRGSATTEGTPQGAVISPLLANIYLHYVLDQWVGEWRRRAARGEVYLVRYADDFVMGFQHRDDAERLLADLRERLAEFGLELHQEKTRLFEFGRFANENRVRRGQGKPETFDFLGFTHLCGKTRTNGRFTVLRQTIAKRLRKKVQEVREWLMAHRHDPVSELGTWLRSVVQGYYNYHAVPCNGAALETFRREVNRAWLHALRRRSPKGRHLTWDRAKRLFETWLPKPRILHPYPSVRFHARHPR